MKVASGRTHRLLGHGFMDLSRGHAGVEGVSRDGVRVETRLLQQVGPEEGAWAGVAYVWDRDQSDAWTMPDGMADALGTRHDVPSTAQCNACHGGRRSHVLGFSAVQLAYEAAPGELDVGDLVAEGLISVPPSREPRVPGDATERAAL